MTNNNYEDPFLKIIPKLDLHGYTSDMIPFAVSDYINISIKMGYSKIGFIHGRHGGIIKKSVHECLKRDKRIKKYYTYYENDGVTVVEL